MFRRKRNRIRSSEDFWKRCIISKEPPSLLLLASKLGYQTRSFAEAARRLGVGVIIGSDRCHQLEDPWADGAIPLHFEDAQNAAARLAELFRAAIRKQDRRDSGVRRSPDRHRRPRRPPAGI